MNKSDIVQSWFSFPSVDDPKVEGFSKENALALNSLDIDYIYKYIQANSNFSNETKSKWIDLVREISTYEDLKYFDYLYINGPNLGTLTVKLNCNSCGRLAYLEMTLPRQNILFSEMYASDSFWVWGWQEYFVIGLSGLGIIAVSSLILRLLK